MDFVSLTKPELTLLSVGTAVVSAYLARPATTSAMVLLHVLVGTSLIGGACGVLNQYMERSYDALMKRTERRPVPSGRVAPRDALLFGVALAILGILYLELFTSREATLLGSLTIVTYLGIYTPLKRRSPFATIVGGIPGALPPLIGWAASYHSLSRESWTLFFILFFWQMPHFLSLAWLYRRDYARAGYRMLTAIDEKGIVTSRQIVVYAVALLAASLAPTLVGLAGTLYFYCALLASGLFAVVAVSFFLKRTNAVARRLFYASLLYLPTIFLLLMIDHRG